MLNENASHFLIKLFPLLLSNRYSNSGSHIILGRHMQYTSLVHIIIVSECSAKFFQRKTPTKVLIIAPVIQPAMLRIIPLLVLVLADAIIDRILLEDVWLRRHLSVGTGGRE